MFGALVVRLAIHKYYSLDEFQYAHAAWLVAHGQVPYRDFYQYYMPLLYTWMSGAFLFVAENPTAILALRVTLLPFVAAIAWSCDRLNRDSDGRWAVVAPLFLLSVGPFAERAVEIRPDGMAAALFFLSIVALRAEKIAPRTRALLAGVLAGASILASQKALTYGLAFLVAFVLDVSINRREQRRLLGVPSWFTAAAAGVLLVFAAVLALTGAWRSWVEHSLVYSIYHQSHYPNFSFITTLSPVLREFRWLFVLALGGFAVTLRRLVARRRAALGDPDCLAILALLSTFLSFATTRAPFIYCLVPFFPALSVFAARGAIALGRRSLVGRLAPSFVFLVGMVSAVGLERSYERLLAPTTNHFQRSTLRKIGELTRPDEPFFDNSGSAVTRPHVLFHYHADRLQLALRSAELESKGPSRLRESGCVLVILDARFGLLPEGLKRFVYDNYQPYDGDLRIWGRRYLKAPGSLLTERFFAIRDGRYFVHPASALETGDLRIDGRQVDSTTFFLRKGERAIEYSGAAPELSILWLPADGVPWSPRPDLAPRFSIL